MKKLFLYPVLFLLSAATLFSQNTPQGMNYQAVARDADGKVMANLSVDIRIDLISNIERHGVAYSETHQVMTNKFGLFNFVIGEGQARSGDFEEIPWASEEIWLEVALDESGDGDFKIMNTTKLLTVPYAFHAGSANQLIPINPNGDGRVPWWGAPFWNIEGLEKTNPDKHFVGNIDSVDLVFRTNNLERLRITADGEIIMPGDVEIGGTLEVKGDSTIVKSLYVQGLEAVIDSFLYVGEDADFGDNITVNNNITAGGNVTAAGDGTFQNIHALNNGVIDNDFTVGGESDLNGQVTISANLAGADSNYDAYPLRVEGSGQGIAIKTTAGTPDNDNNFITFFNNSGSAVGRIEGETAGEVASEPEFIFDESILVAEEVKAVANVASAAIPVATVGSPVAQAGPCGACIAMAAADLALATANLVAFNIFAFDNLGVTYQSGSADYAEWLERNDPNEEISAGDIVGVTGGKVSKYTANARQFMVISTKPAILGNMPMDGKEDLYEKVAFMGQIPVKIRGLVFQGDYILPSGKNDGTGIAVSPDEIKAEQYRKIVGVAWSSAFVDDKISLINMAIGLNTNDVANLAVQQEKKIKALENKFKTLEQRLLALENGTDYTPSEVTVEIPAIKAETPTEKIMTRHEAFASYMPPELSDEIMEEAMLYLENEYKALGINYENHPGLKKLFTDADYKAEIIKKTQENYKRTYQNLKKIEAQRN